MKKLRVGGKKDQTDPLGRSKQCIQPQLSHSLSQVYASRLASNMTAVVCLSFLFCLALPVVRKRKVTKERQTSSDKKRDP